MPGVSSQASAPTVEIQPYKGGKGSWSTTRETVPSPVRSLLASLNKRVGVAKEMHWRKKMATRHCLLDTDMNDINSDLEPVSHMATDWAEVIFFHQGSQLVDPFCVQGCRQKTAGVSIIPEWQPPSPIASGCTTVSRNPKTLLQTPLVRLPYSSDSQGDDDESDDSCEEPIPVPVISRPVNLTEHKQPALSSLFTPSSSLSTCNIKFLLSSEKFLALPISIQNKLLSNLPAADQRSLLQNTNNLDSVLHNEYISAALREWQSQLILGAFQRKKIRQCENTLPWKEAFYEDYWGERKKTRTLLTRNNDQVFYPTNSNYTHHQKLVHDIVFNYTTHRMNGNCTASSTNLLPVQLPLQAYRVYCISQQIQQEHSYCNSHPIRSTLTLIIGSSCNCQTTPLQVCSSCHKLYHPRCSVVPRCPACIRV